MTHFSQLLPEDEFNRKLEADVHPPDWENPTPSGRYNLVVIGAGTAGLVTAAGAAGLGAKVALIERSLMGGDCLNVGCVPSKAVISAARAAAAEESEGGARKSRRRNKGIRRKSRKASRARKTKKRKSKRRRTMTRK